MTHAPTAHILLVDDSATARLALAEPLRALGISVKEAGDGMQALAMAERYSFDAVVTDVRMPGLNGLSLIRKLRELPGYERLPILVMSGTKSEAMQQRGLALGAAHWLLKPLDPRALAQLVRDAKAK